MLFVGHLDSNSLDLGRAAGLLLGERAAFGFVRWGGWPYLLWRESGQPLLFCPAVHNICDRCGAVKHFVYKAMNAHSDQQSLRVLIQRVLDEAPFSMRQIAEEAGVSYDAIRSWATDRRTPRPESLQQLAAAMERRALRLHELTAELRRSRDMVC